MPKRMRTESSLPENDSSLVRQVDGDRSSYNLQNKDSRDSYPDTENNGLNAEKPLTAEVLDSQKESSPKENEITRSLESESAPPSQQEKTRRVSSSRQREKSPYPTSRPQTPPMDTLRTQSPIKASSGTAESKAEEKNKQNTSSAAVVVSNLPKKMSEIMLFEFFGGCGEIKTINAFDDDRKAYIEFENLDDAQEALQLNGTKIEDTQIQVHPAKSEFIDDRAHDVVSGDYVDDKQMTDNWNDERAINDRGMRVDSGHDVRGRKFDFEREREQKYEYRNEDTGRGRYRGRQRYDRRDNNRRTGSFREQDWDRDNRNREHRSGYRMTPSSAHQNRSGSIPKEREPDTDNFWSRDQDIRTLYVSGFSPDYDAVKLQAMFAEKGLQKEVVEARIVIDPKDQMAKFGFVDIYSSGLQRALAFHNTKHGESILKITESERPR
ncbi:hypothetical protein BKA69DRAFT_1114247 [Paraphysoderma sedebokerense]|nr:hypothetical protein BKA69DRAFT_1114247 [Paraphysoderma sedebokerense]